MKWLVSLLVTMFMLSLLVQPVFAQAAAPSQDKKPAINLQDYVGRYEVDPDKVENFILDVFIEKDELWIKPSHSPKRKLISKGSDSFTLEGMELAHKFNRDAKGAVQSLTIEGNEASNGQSASAKKLTLP